MKNEIASIEIINTSWECIGPDDISEVRTKICRNCHMKIDTFKGISEKPAHIYEQTIENKVVNDFFYKLVNDVKILNWEDNYSVMVYDGYQWKVIITLEDKSEKKIQGTVELPPQGKLLREMIYEMINDTEKPWIF